mmetsp:Transcript_67480/g.133137  ORF Transcript_67480/g.133137 Transcript_67480/m.133137 type:complete len:284 (-) Transcript_67480:53-904(-)
MFSMCTRPFAILALLSPLTLRPAAGFSFTEIAQEGYKAVHDGLVASGVLPPEPATWEEVGGAAPPEQAQELQKQLQLQQMQQQQLQQQDLRQRQLQQQLQRQEQQLQQEQLQSQRQHQFPQSPLQSTMVGQAPQQLQQRQQQQQQQQVHMQQQWSGQSRPLRARRKSLVAMGTSGAYQTLAAPPAPAAAGVIQRPKGWDQCMHFARYVKSKQVTGPELVRTWKGTCEPAVQSGRATERYRLMCNSLGGAVEPFASQVDYNVEQLCDTVLVLFHELTAADSAAR